MCSAKADTTLSTSPLRHRWFVLRCTCLSVPFLNFLVVSFMCRSCQRGRFAGEQLKRLRDEAEGAGQYKKVEERTDGSTCNEHKKNKQKKKKQQGWFGWWGNLTHDDKAKQDGDVSIDDLGAFIAEKDKPKEVCGKVNGHLRQGLRGLFF